MPLEQNWDLAIEIQREGDGRWLAAVPVLPGVMIYGATEAAVLGQVQALALRVLADRLEDGEERESIGSVTFHTRE